MKEGRKEGRKLERKLERSQKTKLPSLPFLHSLTSVNVILSQDFYVSLPFSHT